MSAHREDANKGHNTLALLECQFGVFDAANLFLLGNGNPELFAQFLDPAETHHRRFWSRGASEQGRTVERSKSVTSR